MTFSSESLALALTVIESVRPENIDETLEELRFFFPDTLLLASLDLIDRENVIKYKMPWGRSLYEVFGSTATYSVFPEVLSRNDTSMAYCTCPAFAYSVLLSGSQLMCKHLLATLLAQRLSKYVERPIAQDDLVAIVSRQCS